MGHPNPPCWHVVTAGWLPDKHHVHYIAEARCTELAAARRPDYSSPQVVLMGWGYVVFQEAPNATGCTNDDSSLAVLHLQYGLIPALLQASKQPAAKITHSSSHPAGP